MDQTATRQTSGTETGQLDAALNFARRAHDGQRRKQNGRPFVEHPIAVKTLLAERDLDETILISAYLHDTIEKADTGLGEIERAFGREVARIVDALSEDPAIEPYGERKRALRAKALAGGRETTIVYAADRLCNLRDWRELDPDQRDAAAARLNTTLDERLRLWGEDVEALHELHGDVPFLEEVELELRALRAG